MVVIKRDAYEDLLDWKDNTDQVAFIEGARQVGKTFLAQKFCEENFKRVIYINLLEDTGEKFVSELNKTDGIRGEKELIIKALKCIDADFTDSFDTVVIIDEIQETARVYNKIRSFHRYFRCRFIVTGSYLGRTLYDRNYWESIGDSYTICVKPLTFREFLCAVDNRYLDIFDNIDLYGNSPKPHYEILKRAFSVYTVIGGYPAIVASYLKGYKGRNLFDSFDKLLYRFSNESGRYLGVELNSRLILDFINDLVILLSREKKGLHNNNVSEEIIKLEKTLPKKEGALALSKKQYDIVLNWLLSSKVVESCYKYVNCNMLECIPNQRFFLNDVGLLRYLSVNNGISANAIVGLICETYVFNTLKNKLLKVGFATLNNYELDFLVSEIDLKIGIEVKSGKEAGVSVKKIYEKGLIDKILYLKGDTYGGKVGNIETVPIYLFEKYEIKNYSDIINETTKELKSLKLDVLNIFDE